jgi:hypothetical protein
VNGSGTGGPLTSLQIPGGVFATSADFPGTLVLGGVRVAAQNGAGAFGGLTPSGGGGTMPFVGSARLCFLVGCDVATLFADLPISVVGVGGTTAADGPIGVTLQGAPWTKGTFVITTPGLSSQIGGFAHGPASQTGSTAQPGGLISLVTPIMVSTSLPGFEVLPSFAVLTVEFLPEPGTLLLVAGGLALLAQRARSRQRG